MPSTARSGLWLLLVAALAGLAAGLVAYFWQPSGVSGTAGALLACVGCAALGVAALILLFAGTLPRWLRRVVDVLVGLGILGTGFAGYLLMQTWIVVAMAVALAAFILYLTGRRGAAA